MALQYLAGQRLTADALQKAVPDRVTQLADQTVTSSVALVDSSIMITVDGLMRLDVDFRWGSAGGGIRWDWQETGSVTMIYRAILAAGSGTSGTVTNIADIQARFSSSFGTDVTVANFTSNNFQRGSETLIVDGSGTLTLRFAQETSNVNATTLFADSSALVTRLGS